MLFFIVPPKTLERGVNCHNAAIDCAGKMLFDLFKSGIWMGSDKHIEFLQACSGKYGLTPLILRLRRNVTYLSPLPQKLANPER